MTILAIINNYVTAIYIVQRYRAGVIVISEACSVLLLCAYTLLNLVSGLFLYLHFLIQRISCYSSRWQNSMLYGCWEYQAAMEIPDQGVQYTHNFFLPYINYIITSIDPLAISVIDKNIIIIM